MCPGMHMHCALISTAEVRTIFMTDHGLNCSEQWPVISQPQRIAGSVVR